MKTRSRSLKRDLMPIEEAIKYIAPSKVNNLIEGLKDLAKTDTKIEGVVKRFNLL